MATVLDHLDIILINTIQFSDFCTHKIVQKTDVEIKHAIKTYGASAHYCNRAACLC